MAVPKRKTSNSRKGMRRSHHAIGQINIAFDSITGEAKLPHHMSVDGYYKGKKIIVEKPKNEKVVASASSEAKAEEETKAVQQVENNVDVSKESK